MNQRNLIIILTAVLLAVVVASGAVLWLLPNTDMQEVTDDTPAQNREPATSETRQEQQAQSSGAQGFNINVLDRSEYKSLNSGLIQSGKLPVKPPAQTGKANPFF